MNRPTRDYNDTLRKALALPVAAAMLAACATTTPAPVQEEYGASAGHGPGEPHVTAAPTERAAGSPVPPASDGPVIVRTTARYVVQPGDTLWGIAERFYFDPWQWPNIWVANREVANPHLIFPGDVLEIRWEEGEPRVQRVEKLSPRIRERPLDVAIPTIPLEQIRDFLRSPRIVDEATLQAAPYVVEFDREHLIAPDQVGIYVRNLPDNGERDWLVVRPGDAYRDPDTGRVLGYEAIPAADARLHRVQDPVATLVLTRAYRETRVGDRLLPMPRDLFAANFFPRPPDEGVHGRIIAVVGGVTQIGQYQVVTLNRGAEHGLETGHVLDVMQAGREVADPYRRLGRVQLPSEYAGQLLVFQVYDKLAHALVMDAIRPIHLHDEVRQPRPRVRTAY